ncbi:MAG: efflux RND transporter periplasmic adaptor subunit [Candidatus Zixiibacteriota bacterium]
MYFGVPLLIIIILIAANMMGGDEDVTLVQADLVTIDDISEVVSASGRIQPQTKVDIVAEVSAEIIEVPVNDGDWVTKGQTLLLLDTVQAKSDAEQARYSLDELTSRTEAARTQYEMDEQEHRRQKGLFEKNLTSDMEYTNARLRFENSKANYEAMLAQTKTGRARLEKAEDNLTKTHIRAPMDGVITYMNAEVGEIAQAQTSFTQGRTLMTISDLSVFEVEVDVDETEIAKIDLGQPADIRVDAFRDTTFKGSVTEIGNSALVAGEGTENYTTSFRVKVRFAETGVKVRPGMSATVDITTATAEDAMLVPYAAVVTREVPADSPEDAKTDESASAGGAAASEVTLVSATDESSGEVKTADEDKVKEKVKKSGVFRITNGTVEFVEIETGIADERNIVALSNLNEGDTIVSGSFQTLRKLEAGETVAIEEESIKRMEKDE